MPPDIKQLSVPDLLLDVDNPRLPTAQRSQQEAALSLAEEQGDHLVKLAEDIAEFGLDPTALMWVLPAGGRHERYVVIEGNRRLLALRALEAPLLVSPVLSAANSKRLNKAATAFSTSPISTVLCVVFATREEANRWITLRHTGQNQGAGLVGWGSDEQNRFVVRQGGPRKPAGQIVDFVESQGTLSAEAQASKKKILTNVERLINSPDVRNELGIDIIDGEVVSHFPATEVVKGLTRIVEDLKLGKLKVGDLYKLEDRLRYLAKWPANVRPKKSKGMDAPVALSDLAAGHNTSSGGKKKPRRGSNSTRNTVIPKGTQLNVTSGRIHAIYKELRHLRTEQYPNACSVLLRVFVELSVDAYIEDKKLMPEAKMLNTKLADKLKKVAGDLHKNGVIGVQLKRAVDTVANGGGGPVIAPTVPTFNQYVHNPHVFPAPTELYSAWDGLSPFMEKLWP